MTQSKSSIKNSKLFYMYAALLLYVVQHVGPIFSAEKLNEYFLYHPEIFLGVFYDNLC